MSFCDLARRLRKRADSMFDNDPEADTHESDLIRRVLEIVAEEIEAEEKYERR